MRRKTAFSSDIVQSFQFIFVLLHSEWKLQSVQFALQYLHFIRTHSIKDRFSYIFPTIDLITQFDFVG